MVENSIFTDQNIILSFMCVSDTCEMVYVSVSVSVYLFIFRITAIFKHALPKTSDNI